MFNFDVITENGDGVEGFLAEATGGALGVVPVMPGCQVIIEELLRGELRLVIALVAVEPPLPTVVSRTPIISFDTV